jgi:two-component system chemotaxis response regulator CheY
MKSLVVEDEFSSRALLQSLLARYGECHIAISGEEAVNAFRVALESGHPYGLVCMDIRLPGMDGVKAVRCMRDIEEQHRITSTYGARILMTTATGSPDTVIESFGALCDGYFVKPIDAAAIQNELQRLGLIR